MIGLPRPINTIIVDPSATQLIGKQYATIDAACAYINALAGYAEIGTSTVTVAMDSDQASIASPSLLNDGDILAIATTGQTTENDYKIQSVDKNTGAAVLRCGFRWASGTYSVTFRRPVEWVIRICNGAYSLGSEDSLRLPNGANVSLIGETKSGVIITGNGKGFRLSGTSGSVLLKNMTATVSGSGPGSALLASYEANTVGLSSAYVADVIITADAGYTGNSIFFIGASFGAANLSITNIAEPSPDIWVDQLDINGLTLSNAGGDGELMSFSAGGQVARTNYATKSWNVRNVLQHNGFMYFQVPSSVPLARNKVVNLSDSRFDGNTGAGQLLTILGPAAGASNLIVNITDCLIGDAGSTADYTVTDTTGNVTVNVTRTTKTDGVTPCVVG